MPFTSIRIYSIDTLISCMSEVKIKHRLCMFSIVKKQEMSISSAYLIYPLLRNQNVMAGQRDRRMDCHMDRQHENSIPHQHTHRLRWGGGCGYKQLSLIDDTQ